MLWWLWRPKNWWYRWNSHLKRLTDGSRKSFTSKDQGARGPQQQSVELAEDDRWLLQAVGAQRASWGVSQALSCSQVDHLDCIYRSKTYIHDWQVPQTHRRRKGKNAWIIEIGHTLPGVQRRLWKLELWFQRRGEKAIQGSFSVDTSTWPLFWQGTRRISKASCLLMASQDRNERGNRPLLAYATWLLNQKSDCANGDSRNELFLWYRLAYQQNDLIWSKDWVHRVSEQVIRNGTWCAEQEGGSNEAGQKSQKMISI